MNPATGTIQKEIMLIRGNAMSSAPIWSGIRRLPNTPAMSGMSAKNTMNVACIVTREL